MQRKEISLVGVCGGKMKWFSNRRENVSSRRRTNVYVRDAYVGYDLRMETFCKLGEVIFLECKRKRQKKIIC